MFYTGKYYDLAFVLRSIVSATISHYEFSMQYSQTKLIMQSERKLSL